MCSVQAYVTIPVSSLVTPSSLLILDTTNTPSIPIAPSIGDANLDGFPDMLLIINGTPRLLISQSCTKGLPGCNSDGSGRRGWKEAGKGLSLNAKILQTITDARGASFVDIDEDVRVKLFASLVGD